MAAALEYDRVRKICNAYGVTFTGQFWASSYCFHPHGFCRSGILAYDHHHIDGDVSIFIAENPIAEWTEAGDNSTASYNPLPKPKGCDALLVWRNGKWLKEGPWQEKILSEIAQIEFEIEEAKRKKIERAQIASEEAEQEKAKKEAALVDAWK